MASYIDNIAANSEVMGMPMYTPDWEFLSSAQRTLTQMQTSAFDSFHDKYSLLLQSDLLNPENQKFRDTYMRLADSKIKSVSGMDLTDPRNLNSAMGVFDSLVNNQRYVKDVMFTRSATNALREAEMLRRSPDERIRKMYNPYSVADIQYAMEDFSTAVADEMLNMSVPSYVQGLDLWSRAEQYFEDKNWKRVFDQKSGGYIYTQQNGQLIEEDVYQYLYNRFSEDPLVRDYLGVKSRVERRQFVEENAAAFGNNKEAATRAYLQQRWNQLAEPVRRAVSQYDSDLAKLEYANSEVERALANQEATSNNERLQGYANVAEMFQALRGKRDLMPEIDEQGISTIENGSMEDLMGMISKIDALEFRTEIGNIAGVLSRRGEQIKMREDQYALATHRASLQDWVNAQDAQRKFQYDMLKMQMEFSANGAGGGTPIAVAGGAGVENVDENSEYLDYNIKALNDKTLESRRAGEEAIRSWSQLTGTPVKNSSGQVVSLDNLSTLSESDFTTYLENARAVSERGTRDLEDPEGAIALRRLLRTYDERSAVAANLLAMEQGNLMRAIEMYNASSDDEKKAVRYMKELIASGVVDREQLEAQFIERWDRERDRQISNAPVIGEWLVNSPKFAVWATTNAGKDVWAEVFGGVTTDISTWGGESTTVSGYYKKNAESLAGALSGQTTNVGYEQRMGTNLGFASSKGSPVNAVVNTAVRSVDIDAGAVGFGSMSDALNGNLVGSDLAETVLRRVQTILNTRTSGNTNPRNMPVTIYENNNGEQFMHIALDQTTLDDLQGSKTTPGIARGQEGLSQGLIIKLDAAGALPKSMYAGRTSAAEEVINTGGGTLTIGGTHNDGGSITISRNNDGSYMFYGTRYVFDPTSGGYKDINITKDLTAYINSRGLTLQQAKDYSESLLDAYAAENIKLERVN